MWMRGVGETADVTPTAWGRDDAGVARSAVAKPGSVKSGANGAGGRGDASWRGATARPGWAVGGARVCADAPSLGAAAAGCIGGSAGIGGTARARPVVPVSSIAAMVLGGGGAADGFGARDIAAGVCTGACALGAAVGRAPTAAAKTSGAAEVVVLVAARRRGVGARAASAAAWLRVAASTGARASAGGGRGTANSTGSPGRSGSAMRCK